MKSLFILTIHVFLSFTLFAQSKLIEGKIKDKQTGEAVVGASIAVGNSGLGTITDSEGKFSLSIPDNTSEIKVSVVGYVSQNVPLNGGSLEIFLDQDLVNLQPVVVSGSREAQQRTDVPAAITQISSKMMEDTKATALFQIMNKVAGVNMVNLGNEQHGMSIRQPITLNAVYLYAEDGLPIRPTGIFNHNSLYEINMAGLQGIEVIKGPASSLFGSNAIGGTVNFITAKASSSPTAKVSIQGDNYGYRRTDIGLGNTFGKVGIYIGGYLAQQRNGWQDYTDMDKYSFNVRVDYKISNKTKLTLSSTYNYLYTQTPGSLDSTKFYSRKYQSNQRFTNREVTAVRSSIRLDHQWNEKNSSFLTLYHRYNSTGQVPSYFIRDVRVSGVYRSSNGQVNNQSFQSFGLLAQHRVDFDFLQSKLIVGAYVDNSPSTYWAKFLSIQKDVANNYYTGYTNSDSLIDNYKLNLFNVALYAQYEMQLTSKLRAVVGLRYDRVSYDFKNSLPENRTSKKQSLYNSYDILAPKLGITYDLGKDRGLYANFSTGFQPPETSSLYGSVQKKPLREATFTNYEVGGWAALLDRKLYLEATVYQLQGTNEIVSILQPDNTIQSENVGSTLHQGLEYAVSYKPINDVSIRFSGTYAIHTYKDYSEVATNTATGVSTTISYNNKRMNNAPTYVGNAEIFYKPHYMQGLRIGLEWQHIDPFFTNNANTKSYKGYDLFNLRVGYQFTKGAIRGFEVWANVINLSDELYSTYVTSNQFGDTYTAAAPRTVSLGVGYNLSRK